MSLRVPLLPLFALLTAPLLLVGCFAPSDAPQAAAREKVVLAIQPTDNPGNIQAQANELQRFLEARTNLDIQILIPMTYTGVVEALRFGHAQVAMMSAWPSLLAHDIGGADIVLAEKREVVIGQETQVQPYYYSYYVVLKESPHQSLAELAGKRVAYPSSTSTSGYVYPLATLVAQDFVQKPAAGEADPKQFFSSVLFAGGYNQAWQALRNGQVDATVIAGDVNQNLYFDVLNQTRILSTQGPIPSHGVVFSKDFAGPGRAELLNAFLELKGEHRDLMRALVSAIFVEFAPTTTDAHTAPLKDALEQVGLRFVEKIG